MNNTGLEIPSPIYFGEEDLMLDYENIKKLTKEAKQKNVQANKIQAENIEIVLTNEEILMVDKWVKEVEKYVAKFASNGSDKFLYDCSKIDTHLFYETALRFKMRNPKFYVETHGGTQMLVVQWNGKNEV